MNDLPPAYDNDNDNLDTAWFLALRPLVEMVRTKSTLGCYTYEKLPRQLQRLYDLRGEEAHRNQREEDAAADLFTWFKKLFVTADLLAMENHGYVYQTFVSPPSVTKLASEDLRPFYRPRSFDGKSWYAATYINAEDIKALKLIQESTTRKLQQAWSSRLQ
jgi:hypothetical protein